MRLVHVQYLDQSATAGSQLWAVAPQTAGGREYLINITLFTCDYDFFVAGNL
jgi:hypothetical protein